MLSNDKQWVLQTDFRLFELGLLRHGNNTASIQAARVNIVLLCIFVLPFWKYTINCETQICPNILDQISVWNTTAKLSVLSINSIVLTSFSPFLLFFFCQGFKHSRVCMSLPVSYVTLASFRDYTWMRWITIVFPLETIFLSVLSFLFSEAEFLSILQASFYAISEENYPSQ